MTADASPKQKSLLTIPNLLTLFRLISAPLFLGIFIGYELLNISKEQSLLICFIIVIVSELSDILDGILARRWKQVSNLGKLLDPYADSCFRLSCFFAFASQAHGKWIPLWMVMILFYRDLLVTVIRTFGVEQGKFVAARASGKIKAIAQGSVIGAALVLAYVKGTEHVTFDYGTGVVQTMMWVVTIVTLWSAFDYWWGNRHLFKSENVESGEVTED